MHPYKLTLTGAAALLASTSLSTAATITVTASHNDNTNWGTSTQTSGFSPTFNLTVPAFNTALGTLTGVNLTIASTANGQITLTNNGSTATSVSAFLLDIFKYSVPGKSGSINLTTGSVTNAALAGGGTFGPLPVSAKSTTTKALTASAAFDVPWSALVGDFGSVDTTSGNGNGAAIYTDQSGVLLTAQYTFTPAPPPPPPTGTPEPASMALLGGALAGLGLVRRRRK